MLSVLFFIFLGTGVITGLLAGILGLGGGIIVVPALLMIFENTPLIPISLQMHVAVASSLAIMVLTTFSAIFAHLRLNESRMSLFIRLAPGLFVGTVLGVYCAEWVPTSLLKGVFACFLLFVAVKMLLMSHQLEPSHFPRPSVHHLVMLLIGTNSGLLGVGGGSLIIPYLTHHGVNVRDIPLLSAGCTFLVALVGATTFLLITPSVADLPLYSTGFIYWPAVLGIAIPSMIFAPVGAKWMYRLPTKQLRYGFIVLLGLIALNILINLLMKGV